MTFDAILTQMGNMVGQIFLRKVTNKLSFLNIKTKVLEMPVNNTQSSKASRDTEQCFKRYRDTKEAILLPPTFAVLTILERTFSIINLR